MKPQYAVAIAVMMTCLSATADERVHFNRDIRPILSDNCFSCHGPDKKNREADLRLDVRDGGAYEDRDGTIAIVPGEPGASELITRLVAEDPDERMPPADSEKELTPDQIELIKTWVQQGAEWKGHWVYEPPLRPAVPANGGQAASVIDQFILDRLKAEQLRPLPEADRRTLIRRLSFDLTGIPPTPAEVDAFVADSRADAYDHLVDRLLGSPRYGERLAVYWLDLVRYADTIGYHSDNPRDVFLYREYVINSLNSNKPFDQFTIEQLAGDLLPDATIEQKIASGYNRLLQTTEEGGAQPKEYLAIYAADRVRNVSGVWMGATMGCSQCHDHKYDPYTMQDFYSMASFFADLKEKAVGKRNPGIQVASADHQQRIAALDAQISSVTKSLQTLTPELSQAMAAWEQSHGQVAALSLGDWSSIGPFKADSPRAAYETEFGPEKGVDLNRSYDEGKLVWQKQSGWQDGKLHTLSGENAATYLYRTITVPQPAALPISLGSDDTIAVWLNGTQLLSKEIYRAAAPNQEQLTLDLKAGENQLLLKIGNGSGDYAFYFNTTKHGLPTAIAAILGVPAEKRSEDQRAQLTQHFLSTTPQAAEQRKQLAALNKQKQELAKSMPRTLVSEATTPREMRILARGNWLDDSGEVVQPALPEFLGSLAAGDRRATRLDLATWVAAADNPMTARVFVNRLWKLFFTAGLARNVDDLGSQGQWPTHPELLDWLAVEFVESGWDIKHMVKLIVTSDAYRRSSLDNTKLRQRDPLNLWLARQSRVRLEAEMIRDNALAVSGLLVERVGGRSVKPYQPGGYWRHLNFPKCTYAADAGDDQYRRGIYTHWQRSFLHPSLLAFDATSREECTADRPRSNTPLQALVLLNDPTYVESAVALADLTIKEGGADLNARLDWAFRRVLSRLPVDRERQLLTQLHTEQLSRYTSDVAAAKALVAVGQRAAADDATAPELAAWTSVARVLLNLHETVTRN